MLRKGKILASPEMMLAESRVLTIMDCRCRRLARIAFASIMGLVKKSRRDVISVTVGTILNDTVQNTEVA
jgi:hypothetical protein